MTTTFCSSAFKVLIAFALLSAPGLLQAEQISHSTFGKIDQWFISEPVVNLPLASPDGSEVGKFYEPRGD